MQRDSSFDISKGLGILVIVFFHLFDFTTDLSVILIELAAVWRMCYFFVISGYFYKDNRTPTANVRRRVKQLLKPYIEYSLGIWLLTVIYNLITKSYTFVQCVWQYVQFLVSRQTLSLLGITLNTGIPADRTIKAPGVPFPNIVVPFWFVITMLFAYIIFFYIARWALSSTARFASVSGGLIMVSFLLNQYVDPLPWNFQNVPMCVALLLIGALLGKYKALGKEKLHGVWSLINSAVALGIILVLELVWKQIGSFAGGMLYVQGAVEVFVCIVFGLLGAYISISVCRYIAKVRFLSKIFSWVGVRSMPILLVHIPIAYFLRVLTPLDYGRGVAGWMSLITYAATVVIMIVYRIVWELILKTIHNKKQKKAGAINEA